MFNRCWIIALVVVFLLRVNTAAIAQNPNNYNAHSIMYTIRHPHNDLTMLAAHRGVHALWNSNDYTTTPENSLQSIQNAAINGIEVVELDVRLTQDGVPILSHDSTWGRETNVGQNWGQCCFNPWGSNPGLTVPDADPSSIGGGADLTGPQETAGLNPSVNAWSLASVQSDTGGIKLRNSTNFQWTTWNENPPTLQNALDFIRTNQIAIVIGLDIKDDSAAQAAWQVVAHNYDYFGTPYAQTVFFKAAATNYPQPWIFQQAFNGHTISPSFEDWNAMNFMPVYQTGMIKETVFWPNSGGFGEWELLNSLTNYVQTYNYPFFVGAEVDLKDDPGILTTLYNKNTTSGGPQITMGNFNPYAEWIDPNDPYQTPRFFNSNGYCCSAPRDWFFNGSPYGLPSDGNDLRLSWDFLYNHSNFNMITTDNVVPMNTWLANRGKRNTGYFH
jgi:glycerophosphoryl diester phosphodiesterase